MSLNSIVLGREQKFMARHETTFGGFTKPTAAIPSGMQVLRSSMSHKEDRITRETANSDDRARTSRIEGKKTSEWSMEKEIIPSATIGDLPDDDVPLSIAFGRKRIDKDITIVDKDEGGAGDNITITLTLRDGTTVSSSFEATVDYAIGASEAATASNLEGAIDADTDLSPYLNTTTVGATITVDTNKATRGVFQMDITSDDTGHATVSNYKLEYKPDRAQCERLSATLVRHSGSLMQAFAGAWVDELKISLSGGDPPTYAFSGGAKDQIVTGPEENNALVTSGNDTLTLKNGNDTNYEFGSIVKVGDDDNSGDGYSVIAVDRGANTIQLGDNLAEDAAADALIEPFSPAQSYDGAPVPGVIGKFTKDLLELCIISAEITLKNNDKPITDEAFKKTAQGFIPGWRDVSGTVKIRARRDYIVHATKYFVDASTTYALAFDLGTAGESAVRILLPTVELMDVPVDFPDSEEVVFDLNFIALGTAVSDQISIQYNSLP